MSFGNLRYYTVMLGLQIVHVILHLPRVERLLIIYIDDISQSDRLTSHCVGKSTQFYHVSDLGKFVGTD